MGSKPTEILSGGMAGIAKEEPMLLIIIVGAFLFLLVIPVFGFVMDLWPIFLIIIVLIFLAWFAIRTVYKDQNKISRGQSENVP